MQRLLESSPEDRFQSAAELGRELDAVAAETVAADKQSSLPKKERPKELTPREPATRPHYPPRSPAAARITAVWEDGSRWERFRRREQRGQATQAWAGRLRDSQQSKRWVEAAGAERETGSAGRASEPAVAENSGRARGEELGQRRGLG